MGLRLRLRPVLIAPVAALLLSGLLLSGLLLCGLLLAPASAKELLPRPDEFVVDEAGWLDPGQERQLIEKLRQYERASSNQILVAILESLEDEDLADYSQRLAEHWAIGQGEKDNGILLAVYAAERQLSIEVGYGLEPVVTDAIAAQIRDQVLVPGFRAQDYYQALDQATDALIAASRGEFEGTGRANADRARRDDGGGGFPIWLLPLILIFIFGGRRGRQSWVGPMLLGAALGSAGRRGGGLGGGGLGGGGGSFLGGGGSFGGGGARGGW